MTETRELANLVAVVTGSSRGIGREIAIELALAGASVVVHAGHDAEGAEKTGQAVRSAGVPALVTVADLVDARSHDALVEQAWNWLGRVDIWVNNAGVDILTGRYRHLTFEEKLDRLWRVDARATIRMSRQVGARMADRGSGAILNIGWDGAERGMAGETAELYAAAKGAVMAFTRSLAQSLAPRVRVNCLALGWIKTAWGQSASEYWQQRARRDSLVNRWGDPRDVAQTARFLVSPAASFITGQVIPLNGGFRTSNDESHLS